MRHPYHTFIIAAYFVLALLGLNITQAQPEVALRPLLVVALVSALLIGLLRILLKDWAKAGMEATLLLFLFFTYGHVYNFLEHAVSWLGRHRILAPVWIILAGMGLWWIVHRSRDLKPATTALNVMAVVLLVIPMSQVLIWETRLLLGGEQPMAGLPGMQTLALPAGEPLPDVYYIILDEYTRQDVLQEVYHYDNTAFLAELTALGFQVVECSQSNYAQTELVLASTLNMSYLDEQGEFLPDSTDHSLLRHLIKDSLVERVFRQLGYQIVAFETGYYFSELEDADVFLSPGGNIRSDFLGDMSAFEVMLLKTTAGLVLLDLAERLPELLVLDTSQPLEVKRQQVLFDLEQLAAMPMTVPEPKFVFAHILLPHEPFVFAADGTPVNYVETLSTEEYTAGYIEQVAFLNDRMLEVLHSIIDNSATPPIIIVQGDTGPGRASHAGRVAVLSAYYLPGRVSSLPAGMTPVNNFRLVFDNYFNGRLGLLADASFFSTYDAPYDFELIPNTCIP